MSEPEMANRGGLGGLFRNTVAPSCPFPPGKQQRTKGRGWLRNLGVALLFGLLALTGAGTGAAATAPPAPPATGAESLDFQAAAHLALKQSPYLTRSSLEIQIRRLDESDSRWGMVPPVTFSTRYYVNRPAFQDLNPRPYYISFSTESYNPFESYFTLQARELATQIAILGHMKVIADGLRRLAGMFIQLDGLTKLAAVQAEMKDAARQNRDYAKRQFSLGQVTSLDVQVATQELAAAEAEGERLASARHRLEANLQAFLGLPADRKVTFNLQNVQSQVLDQFQPAGASLEQARSRSYELKIQALKKELQARNITLAKTRLLPTVVMGVQTPDPLSMFNAQGYYYYVGLNFPIWDGFTRKRNITRQKLIMKQMESEGDLAGVDLSGKWQEAREQLRSAGAALKLAKSQEELAALKERQAEIRYRSEGAPLSVFLEARQGYLETRKNTIMKTVDDEQAQLEIRYLSGDLSNRYVHMASFQE
jgi:outer membrane protein TolC